MFAKLMKYVFQWESKRNNEKKLVSAQWQSTENWTTDFRVQQAAYHDGKKGQAIS